MMTAIALLQVAGLVVVTAIARAALVLAVIAVFSVPMVAFAYAARAAGGSWRRHHGLRHSHHHA